MNHTLSKTTPHDLPSVSVVIPAYNEEKLLSTCLDALHSQTYAPAEIVVVDNNSTDRTVEIARSYPLVRIVRETQQGITYARTTGFDAARSDIIARTDADSIVTRNWVQTIAESFRDDSVDAICGGTAIAEFSPPGRFWVRWYYRFFRMWHEHSIGISPVMYGYNCAMRRTAWEKAHRYITLGDQQISEDLDVTLSLMSAGCKVVFVPALVVKVNALRTLNFEKLNRYYRTDSNTITKHHLGNRRRWVSES